MEGIVTACLQGNMGRDELEISATTGHIPQLLLLPTPYTPAGRGTLVRMRDKESEESAAEAE